MQSLKDRAQAFRLGLIGGYVSIPEVVSWADALIAEDHGLVVSQLFDLALLRPTDLGRRFHCLMRSLARLIAARWDVRSPECFIAVW